MAQHIIKAILDDQGRLVLPPEIARHYQPGQEIEVGLTAIDPNPFLKAIGIIPPLPGGNLAFTRGLKGHLPSPDEIRAHIVANLKLEGIETTSEELQALSTPQE